MKEWDAKEKQRDASRLPNPPSQMSELGCDWDDKVAKCRSNQGAKDGEGGTRGLRHQVLSYTFNTCLYNPFQDTGVGREKDVKMSYSSQTWIRKCRDKVILGSHHG